MTSCQSGKEKAWLELVVYLSQGALAHGTGGLVVHTAIQALPTEGVSARRGNRLVKESVAKAALQVFHRQQ